MTAPAVVRANFWEDVRQHLLLVLAQAGIAVKPENRGDAHAVCVAYYNVIHKLIEPRPRPVLHSRELAARELPADVASGVRLIEALSIAGESLEAHLSDRAMRAHTHDWLRNNWGIHHLHPFAEKERDELLYVVVEPDSLYLLDVLGHDDMADVKLPEIVLQNWPQLLTPMPGLKGGETPTKEEIDTALRAGVQPIFPLSNGVMYAPRGGGVTTAGGSSVRAVDRTHRVLRLARDRERECREDAERIARTLSLAELHLRYDVMRDVVIETKTGQHLLFR